MALIVVNPQISRRAADAERPLPSGGARQQGAADAAAREQR